MMANPQPTDAHLRIAHSIQEQIMVSDFTKRERKILDLILRLSWGCGKKDATIPLQKDFDITGIGEGHIKAELTTLVTRKVITIEGDKYSFNKDFEKWRVSLAPNFSQERLTELVSINLNGHTKTVSPDNENLPKGEVETYRKGKSELTETVSPSSLLYKENIKENIKGSIFRK